jgi:site-specific recombinase XerC
MNHPKVTPKLIVGKVAALVAFCDRELIEDWPAVLVSHVRSFAARSHARGLSPQSRPALETWRYADPRRRRK